ncbi:MAG: NUDIX hydrolase [Gallionellaceae bacterium]|jgi:8-oxo-dGTP pyrophosphatase MutT (NUDIX family)
MIWKPNVTVAAVLEQNGKFLLVEEHTSQGLMFNQPAGHLEPDESIVAGVAREVLEESAYDFAAEYLIGIYRWHSTIASTTYLRFAFGGRILAHHPERPLDEGIVQATWMSLDDIRATQARHRSPLILRCVEDYVAGKRYPLDILTHYD